MLLAPNLEDLVPKSHPVRVVNNVINKINLDLLVLHFQIKDHPDPARILKSDKSEMHKVLCVLTVDQMSIILRAADEARLLIAHSMRAVFNQIVPYLSSPYKEAISPDSIRSKSYIVEERDKEIVIQTLKKLIRKIEEY